jgi:hypothetical protein
VKDPATPGVTLYWQNLKTLAGHEVKLNKLQQIEFVGEV